MIVWVVWFTAWTVWSHGLGDEALNRAAPLRRRLQLVIAAPLRLLRRLLNAGISARHDRWLVWLRW